MIGYWKEVLRPVKARDFGSDRKALPDETDLNFLLVPIYCKNIVKKEEQQWMRIEVRCKIYVEPKHLFFHNKFEIIIL